MGRPSIKSLIYSRIICFIKRGLEHENRLISFFFRNSIQNLHSYLSRNMYIVLQFLNITYEDLRNRSETWLKRACKAEPAMDWRAALLRELMQCRDGIMLCPLQPEEINDIINHLCIEWSKPMCYVNMLYFLLFSVSLNTVQMYENKGLLIYYIPKSETDLHSQS